MFMSAESDKEYRTPGQQHPDPTVPAEEDDPGSDCEEPARKKRKKNCCPIKKGKGRQASHSKLQIINHKEHHLEEFEPDKVSTCTGCGVGVHNMDLVCVSCGVKVIKSEKNLTFLDIEQKSDSPSATALQIAAYPLDLNHQVKKARKEWLLTPESPSWEVVPRVSAPPLLGRQGPWQVHSQPHRVGGGSGDQASQSGGQGAAPVPDQVPHLHCPWG